jgi:GAF domain
MGRGMTFGEEHHSAGVLLAAEHAVAHVLAETYDEASAYPRLLAAIGESLGWDVGAVWAAADDEAGVLRCIETWRGPEPFAQTSRNLSLAPGEGLPGRVWASGAPAWIVDLSTDSNFPRAPAAVLSGLRSAFCFPIHGASGVLAAMEFLAVQ